MSSELSNLPLCITEAKPQVSNLTFLWSFKVYYRKKYFQAPHQMTATKSADNVLMTQIKLSYGTLIAEFTNLDFFLQSIEIKKFDKKNP